MLYAQGSRLGLTVTLALPEMINDHRTRKQLAVPATESN
jgi:hypothetical protein